MSTGFALIESTPEEHVPVQYHPVKLKDVDGIVPARCSYQTVFRWATKGMHGVRLETIQMGDMRVTSRAALTKFFRELAEAKRGKWEGGDA